MNCMECIVNCNVRRDAYSKGSSSMARRALDLSDFDGEHIKYIAKSIYCLLV
jgi:hypothetical protein